MDIDHNSMLQQQTLGSCTLAEGTEMVMPGDNVKIKVTLSCTQSTLEEN